MVEEEIGTEEQKATPKVGREKEREVKFPMKEVRSTNVESQTEVLPRAQGTRRIWAAAQTTATLS